MTKFQFVLLVGFFLGAVTMLLVLGTIYLYLEERQRKRVEVAGLASRGETLPVTGIPPYADNRNLHNCILPSSFEEPYADDEIVYYLSIVIE